MNFKFNAEHTFFTSDTHFNHANIIEDSAQMVPLVAVNMVPLIALNMVPGVALNMVPGLDALQER